MSISNQILEFSCLCIYLRAAGNLGTLTFPACIHKPKQRQDMSPLIPQIKKAKKTNSVKKKKKFSFPKQGLNCKIA